ncbi:hypothetical protein GCM10022220_22610 [Actinocatenispora rupis]|uniref:Uncharacterized protein n=1 Tax=Actinocatenispora rupis TaxID=519421 RepID=A0A8J3NA69_9ACTN|nr:hypothetical protein Aru02nite_26850 [Actinocatenispora rupis]
MQRKRYAAFAAVPDGRAHCAQGGRNPARAPDPFHRTACRHHGLGGNANGLPVPDLHYGLSYPAGTSSLAPVPVRATTIDVGVAGTDASGPAMPEGRASRAATD